VFESEESDKTTSLRVVSKKEEGKRQRIKTELTIYNQKGQKEEKDDQKHNKPKPPPIQQFSDKEQVKKHTTKNNLTFTIFYTKNQPNKKPTLGVLFLHCKKQRPKKSTQTKREKKRKQLKIYIFYIFT